MYLNIFLKNEIEYKKMKIRKVLQKEEVTKIDFDHLFFIFFSEI